METENLQIFIYRECDYILLNICSLITIMTVFLVAGEAGDNDSDSIEDRVLWIAILESQFSFYFSACSYTLKDLQAEAKGSAVHQAFHLSS